LATDDNMKHDVTSWLLTLDNDFFCTRTDALEHDVYHLLPKCHVYIEARIKSLAPDCLLPYYRIFSNPIPFYPFYSFRGPKNQMSITVPCGLDSRSRAGFWKNDGAPVRAVKTIQ